VPRPGARIATNGERTDAEASDGPAGSRPRSASVTAPAQVAKVIELTASSEKSFDDAVAGGIARASKTIEGIQGAWVNEMKAKVENGRVTEYRVNMRVTFVLQE
jgi:hypothetical protein